MSQQQQLHGIVSPHEHDVLSGRGNFVNYHAGNEHFRALVRKHKVAYVACPKPQKGKFSKMIVDEIKSRNPPGRFLKQDASTKLWYDIGEKKALDKTRQALREGAPEIMKELHGDEDDESNSDEHNSSPASPIRSTVQPIGLQKPAGLGGMGGFSQEAPPLPYGNFTSGNPMPPPSLSPSHPSPRLSSDMTRTFQPGSTDPFSCRHAPVQRSISSHLSMPYSAMNMMNLPAHQPTQQLSQQQQQPPPPQPRPPQQLQQSIQQPMQQQSQQDQLRALYRHNSAPPLGLLAAMTAPNGLNMQSTQLHSNVPDNTSSHYHTMDALQTKLNLMQGSSLLDDNDDELEPTPIQPSYLPSKMLDKSDWGGQETVAPLPPPRRIPLKGLLRRELRREGSENSLQIDNVFKGGLDASDHKIKSMDISDHKTNKSSLASLFDMNEHKKSHGSSTHLSVMSLSISDMPSDHHHEGGSSSLSSHFTSSRFSERKSYLGKMSLGLRSQHSTDGLGEMDMSTATLGDRLSDFGGDSMARLSESQVNCSFSNVFEDTDRELFVHHTR